MSVGGPDEFDLELDAPLVFRHGQARNALVDQASNFFKPAFELSDRSGAVAQPFHYLLFRPASRTARRTERCLPLIDCSRRVHLLHGVLLALKLEKTYVMDVTYPEIVTGLCQKCNALPTSCERQ